MNMEILQKEAVILGATGLIGKELLKQLLNHDNYVKVTILLRREIDIEHPKLVKHIIDFDKPEEWNKLINGDELFMAFGTTIKKAGSKEKQYKIDVSYQFEVAKAAFNNGCKKLILVSSAGANSKSTVFYNHLKGRLEDKLQAFDFEKKIIFRPSVLIGTRPEKRSMEKLAIKTIRILNAINIAKKYKAIPGKTVARALINTANLANPKNEYVLDEIFEAAISLN